ncbi:hypothetical protein P43SY_007390 [Pythium insidiosum]|uniref:Uncharacterized protein n=1 Tax=Pythium insidiosum TaxID=114742 RepID=A0AAD5Q7E8_PYTIN|nr:hypothetical protein P43SY_007390 [Pythium insidiosum]
MRAECLTVPVRRRYYAATGSIAHVISLALVVLVVFLPLFLAHGSHGFWPKTSSYLEQPRVQLTYIVLSVLEGERVASNGAKEYLRLVPSSLPPRIQRLLQENTRASQIKAAREAVGKAGPVAPEELLRRSAERIKPSRLDDKDDLVASLDNVQFYKDFAVAPGSSVPRYETRATGDLLSAGRANGSGRGRGANAAHRGDDCRRFDFRLTPDEEAKLRRLGFVVSKRLTADSFAEIYYRIYSDDLPVYITADSVLHAWHRSFDTFLVELEEESLIPLLDDILSRSRRECRGLLTRAANDTHMGTVLGDVEFYLSVALSLLKKDGSGLDMGIPSNQARVQHMLQAIDNGRLVEMDLFGSSRSIDFSMFKPRGHYNASKTLGHYFRAMMWLGTVDFRVAGTDDPSAELHQLQCAVALVCALRDSEAMVMVNTYDVTLSALVGDGPGCDSMTAMDLARLVPDTPDMVANYLGSNQEALIALQAKIIDRKLGQQAIAGHPLVESEPRATAPTALPTSFALLGQRFVWSAFVFSKLVYDQVLEAEEKVIRRLPSAVDAMFAMLGNDVAAVEIGKRMTASSDDKDFVPFRDGVPYATNLLALREMLDTVFANTDPNAGSHRHFFINFADVMDRLKDVAECQAVERPLTEEQIDFVKTVIEERHGSGGSRYLGWYPSLFLANREDSGKQDHIVADVHTDVPSVEHRDPGGILHLGVGNVHYGYFIVDKTMYAGPVFSTYEFVTPIDTRLTDAEFSKTLHTLQMPSWATDSYVA